MGMSCVYRRPSGIYAVRLVVPKRLRTMIGRGEIHSSTGSRDWNSAKLLALQIQFAWRERLMVMENGQSTVEAAMLKGDGIIPLREAARITGLTAELFLSELRNIKGAIVVWADGWVGWTAKDHTELDRDSDGIIDLDEVRKNKSLRDISGWLRPFNSAATIAALAENGEIQEVGFRGKGRSVAFTSEPQTISVSTAWVSKAATEKIRARLGVTFSTVPNIPPASQANSSAPSNKETPLDWIDAKHGWKRFSELFALLREHRAWKVVQAQRMATEAGLFIDLMKDPYLRDISDDTIHQYANLLRRMPANIYQHGRKMPTKPTAFEQIEDAEKRNLERKSDDTVKGHVDKLSQVFAYGVEKAMLRMNPAKGYKKPTGTSAIKTPRAQDERYAFNEEELQTIFSQSWFANGKGKLSRNGDTAFRPYHYWLPLLGLLCGGRRNELAQLYLDDLKEAEKNPGIWYVDFNLDQPDKLDLDDPDIEPDKTLKTVNAIRIVPLHSKLIDLGFIDYVKALRNAGYERLFPELKGDPTRGYGKPAGKWFNEKFLGLSLGFKRDGTKVFHSLRHSFLTATERTEATEHALAQIAGHSRGKTQSFKRYVKDRTAKELQPTIELVSFDALTGVRIFDTEFGLTSIKVALKRKQAMARRKKPTPK
jgi:integrase